MLNYVNAVFNGFKASSEKKVLFGHVVDSPDSISESSLEQKTKCSCPAENHRFVSSSLLTLARRGLSLLFLNVCVITGKSQAEDSLKHPGCENPQAKILVNHLIPKCVEVSLQTFCILSVCWTSSISEVINITLPLTIFPFMLPQMSSHPIHNS